MYHTSEKPNSFHGLGACLGLNEMNSSLVVFYKFGRICVWVWPENNGYILLTSKVETLFEILEFVRILPRTVGFCLKHLLKSLWGKAKLLSGLIHSEESRLLNVGECPNKWVCVCFWACFASYHWIKKKEPESRLSSYLLREALMEKYFLTTVSGRLSPVVSLSTENLFTEFC